MQKPEYLHDGDFAIAVIARNGGERRHPGPGEAISHLQDPIHETPPYWRTVIKSASMQAVRLESWFAECALWGHEVLQNAVEIDPKRRGGIPVLRGTRFTVGQTLAELADSSGVTEVAGRFDLDEEPIRELLAGLALLVERPCR
jgi:uncharacterized protein (DUF433 family)